MFERSARAVAAFGIAVAVAAVTSVAQAATFNPPKHYYLALGDSAAFGAQLGKFFEELATGSYDPASFNTGYVDDFAAILRSIDPGLETVNLGCPGESTSSYMTACPFKAFGLPLHTKYSGSQESAAVAFLRSHPGQVSPITIDIGLNDAAFPCASPTFLIDVGCLHNTMPAALVSVARNLPKILDELQSASPSSEIIVMTYWNPFYVQDASTDSLIESLNDEITSIAAVRQIRVADAFTPFNRTGDEVTTLCALTLMCPNQDIHPSDAGYAVIAQQFWSASGYARLSPLDTSSCSHVISNLARIRPSAAADRSADTIIAGLLVGACSR